VLQTSQGARRNPLLSARCWCCIAAWRGPCRLVCRWRRLARP
jgi:hypothetical protein